MLILISSARSRWGSETASLTAALGRLEIKSKPWHTDPPALIILRFLQTHHYALRVPWPFRIPLGFLARPLFLVVRGPNTFKLHITLQARTCLEKFCIPLRQKHLSYQIGSILISTLPHWVSPSRFYRCWGYEMLCKISALAAQLSWLRHNIHAWGV